MDKITVLLLVSIIILALLMMVVCRKGSSSKFGDNKVITAMNKNIPEDSVLIFYAPWCGHCKKNMNEFVKAVDQSNGKVILIDSTEGSNKDIVDNYKVRGFPTIMKASGEVYDGDRKADDILEFANN